MQTPTITFDSPKDCYMSDGGVCEDGTDHRVICGNFVRMILGKPHHSLVPQEIALRLDSEEREGALPIRLNHVPYSEAVPEPFVWEWETDHPDLKEICETDETLFPPVDEWIDTQYKQGLISPGEVYWVSVVPKN